jgi:hypothetical protein
MHLVERSGVSQMVERSPIPFLDSRQSDIRKGREKGIISGGG